MMSYSNSLLDFLYDKPAIDSIIVIFELNIPVNINMISNRKF